jgi:hypothetical protein
MTRAERLLVWFGHYWTHIWIAVMVVQTVARPAASVTDPGPVRLVWALVGGLSVGCLALITIGLTVHERSLCDRHVPFDVLRDPDGAVRRARWALRGWRRSRRVHAFAAAGLAIVVIVVVLAVPGWNRSVAGMLACLAAMAPLTALTVVNHLHDKLQPWCRWCRDDGGDGSLQFDPDPDPAVRERPKPGRA